MELLKRGDNHLGDLPRGQRFDEECGTEEEEELRSLSGGIVLDLHPVQSDDVIPVRQCTDWASSRYERRRQGWNAQRRWVGVWDRTTMDVRARFFT